MNQNINLMVPIINEGIATNQKAMLAAFLPLNCNPANLNEEQFGLDQLYAPNLLLDDNENSDLERFRFRSPFF